MNDPHVDKLHYKLIHDDSTDYKKAEPLQVEERDFSVILDQQGATFEMKTHCATEQEARALVDPYVDSWNSSATLNLRPGEFTLRYKSPVIVDRKPTPGIVELAGISASASTGKVELHISKGRFPEPPENFSLSPDVNWMIQRYSEHKMGREPLLSMANFFLTRLGASAVDPSTGKDGGKKAASVKYNISNKILTKISTISANRGSELEARKAQISGYVPLTQTETDWLNQVIKAIIFRVGEYVFDPTREFREIILNDFAKI